MKYNSVVKLDFVKLDYERQKKLIDNPELALPFADKATADSRKFTHYLFNPENRRGYAKGAAFKSRLGYTNDNWKLLRKEIAIGSKKYIATFKGGTEFGDRYEQDMVIYGLKGKPANVKVAWMSKDKRTWMTTLYIEEIER